MKALLWNLVLALLWTIATGAFTFPNLLLGFALGFAVLFLVERAGGPSHYAIRCWSVLRLLVYFIGDLFLSNMRVTHDILTPRHRMNAGILAVPLDVRSDIEITVFAGLLTLTPGTLCLDVSTDRKVMYIHAMYVQDPEKFLRKLKGGLEQRVIAALRPRSEMK
jgi:multicomponent Na+:H+ antiporter subunit E